MKRIALLTTATLLVAGLAFAYGPGYGMNGGQPCYGQQGGQKGMQQGMKGQRGMRGQGGPCFQQDGEFKQLTKDEAKTKVEEVIAEYKGYKIVDQTAVQMPRGTMYQFTVKDAGGNDFYYHVNPFGLVRGPIKQFKAPVTAK